MKLQGKVALVTGAGAGIGAAIAKRLAAEGATVHVTGARPENTRKVTQEIRDAGGEAIGRLMDVGEPRAVAATIGAIISDSGQLDILVANAALAGMSAYLGPITDVTDEQWNRVISVNLSGYFYCAREAARHMIPRKSGTIIAISSVNGFVADADVPAYAASKGGMNMLTKSLARDLGPHGIRVNAIAPGGTDTPKMLEAIRQLGLSREELVSRIPIGRRAQAEEIAAIAAFLATDEASYITGHILVADGGQLCT